MAAYPRGSEAGESVAVRLRRVGEVRKIVRFEQHPVRRISYERAAAHLEGVARHKSTVGPGLEVKQACNSDAFRVSETSPRQIEKVSRILQSRG